MDQTYTFALKVLLTARTMPVALWHLVQWRRETRDVVGARARVAHEQTTAPVTRPTLVIVLVTVDRLQTYRHEHVELYILPHTCY